MVELESDRFLTEPLVALNATVLSDFDSQNFDVVTVTGAVTTIRGGNIFKIRKVRFITNDQTEFLNNTGEVVDPLPINKIGTANVSGTRLDSGLVLATRIILRKVKPQ